MTTTPKLLLTISLTAFALSTTGLFWGIALPIGAITFGLFMIFKLLEKESALYDTEQRMLIQRAQSAASPSSPSPMGREVVAPRAVAPLASR